MEISELTAAGFAEFINCPEVIVDFYAVWCGPCRNMSRELEKFAAEHPHIPVGKVNIDNEKNALLTASYDVSTIPSVFLFRNGAVAAHVQGFFSSKVLAEKLGIDQ